MRTSVLVTAFSVAILLLSDAPLVLGVQPATPFSPTHEGRTSSEIRPMNGLTPITRQCIDCFSGFAIHSNSSSYIRGTSLDFRLPAMANCTSSPSGVEFESVLDGSLVGSADTEMIALDQGCSNGTGYLTGHWIDTYTGNQSNFSFTANAGDHLYLVVQMVCGIANFSARDITSRYSFAVSDPRAGGCASKSLRPARNGAACGINMLSNSSGIVPLEDFKNLSFECTVKNFLNKFVPLRNYVTLTHTLYEFVTYDSLGNAPLTSVNGAQKAKFFTIAFVKAGP